MLHCAVLTTRLFTRSGQNRVPIPTQVLSFELRPVFHHDEEHTRKMRGAETCTILFVVQVHCNVFGRCGLK